MIDVALSHSPSDRRSRYPVEADFADRNYDGLAA
nr:MAG TPA: hypothetical protein [Caudoviricetes sp.]DAH61493.1 MAG TPA: hypothetical protein [Caudoviricetes sp.]